MRPDNTISKEEAFEMPIAEIEQEKVNIGNVTTERIKTVSLMKLLNVKQWCHIDELCSKHPYLSEHSRALTSQAIVIRQNILDNKWVEANSLGSDLLTECWSNGVPLPLAIELLVIMCGSEFTTPSPLRNWASRTLDGIQCEGDYGTLIMRPPKD